MFVTENINTRHQPKGSKSNPLLWIFIKKSLDRGRARMYIVVNKCSSAQKFKGCGFTRASE